MPWGLPLSLDDPRFKLDEAWSFRCTGCRLEHFRHSPYCPECGQKHPSEDRAFGVSGVHYRRVWKLPELAVEFNKFHGWTTEVGSFVLSHAELSISVWNEGSRTALVYCAGVERIEATPGRWSSRLRVESASTTIGDGFAMLDEAVRFRVICGMLSVYVRTGE